jgi:hypothetical protein
MILRIGKYRNSNVQSNVVYYDMQGNEGIIKHNDWKYYSINPRAVSSVVLNGEVIYEHSRLCTFCSHVQIVKGEEDEDTFGCKINGECVINTAPVVMLKPLS